jgi:hypothetical protein
MARWRAAAPMQQHKAEFWITLTVPRPSPSMAALAEFTALACQCLLARKLRLADSNQLLRLGVCGICGGQ